MRNRQVIGSLLVLTAFAAVQRRRLDPSSRTYLLLDVVGSAGFVKARRRRSEEGARRPA